MVMGKIMGLILLIQGGQKDFDHVEHPDWLRVALSWNADHFSRYGHPLHIEQYGRIPKSQWDPPTSQCTAADVPNLCVARGLRDAATWMKFSAMLSHLENGTADYVLFVDADAVVVHPHHDTARLMVDTMEAAGKVMMLADEDWKDRGNTAVINTGVILAKRCPWTVQFLRAVLEKRASGFCKSNEQLCLNYFHRENVLEFRSHTHVASGSVWNRHPKIGAINASGEIVHCMGGAKAALRQLDLTHCGRCPCIHGVCSPKGARGACLDVKRCAERAQGAKGPFAIVTVYTLQSTSTARLDRTDLERLSTAAKRMGIVAVLLVPKNPAVPLRPTETELLSSLGILVVTTRTRTPATLAIGAFGLTEYSAVVVVEKGVRFDEADFRPLLKCATVGSKHGRFLSSAGPNFPLEGRVFAVRPSVSLLAAARQFEQTATYTDDKGWDGAGWSPAHSKPNHRLSGLLWTFLYANGRDARTRTTVTSYVASGLERLSSIQIDPSEWQVTIDGKPLHPPPKTPGCNGVDTRIITTIK